MLSLLPSFGHLRQCSAKIIDLGIAAEFGTRMPSGTPGYMAPEVLKIKGSSLPQNDIFSLGVILYMLLGSNQRGFADDFFGWKVVCYLAVDRCPTVENFKCAREVPVWACLPQCLAEVCLWPATSFLSRWKLQDNFEEQMSHNGIYFDRYGVDHLLEQFWR